MFCTGFSSPLYVVYKIIFSVSPTQTRTETPLSSNSKSNWRFTTMKKSHAMCEYKIKFNVMISIINGEIYIFSMLSIQITILS